MFNLVSKYMPSGDQPEAIRELVKGIKDGKRDQVLLGATGTGKTFTIANVIAQVDKPTLVLAHNKTLAGQLIIESNILYLITIIINQRHMFHQLIRILKKTLL